MMHLFFLFVFTIKVDKKTAQPPKPNIAPGLGYKNEAAAYTDYANDNCLAGCLDWLCVTMSRPD